MLRVLLAVAVVGVLAGCAAPGLEVTKVSEVRPTNGARGVDVYAERRRAGDKVPDFAGDQIMEVRTYRAQEDSEMAGDEFAGARCSVKARDFAAAVVTPARVRVPIYRLQSSPLSVSCEYPGHQQRSIVVEVYNKTKQQNYAASAGSGLVGFFLMTAVNELSDENTHTFAYPLARVVMRPMAKRTASRREP
jgi:hypothetical protein